jgi:hypothetical protein
MAEIDQNDHESEEHARARLLEVSNGAITEDEIARMSIEAVRGYLRMHKLGLWPPKVGF